MKLSAYIARRFAASVALVFLVFFGILMLIDMIEQMRRFSSVGIGLTGAAFLSLLNVPETLYRILPLIFVIGSIANFLALARSSELIVVRAVGRSGLRFLVTPVLVSLTIGLLAVAVLNPLVAATSKAYDERRAALISEGQSVLSVTDQGLWLRQGGAYGQTVIHARTTNADASRLFGVSFLTFGPDGLPIHRIEAREAKLAQGAWVIDQGRAWDLTAANPDLGASNWPDAARLPSDLTPERIRDSFGTPSSVPFWALPKHISALERAGFSARSYKLWFQMELAQPLLLTAMVLVAAGFTLRHTRAGHTGRMVLYAILCGFALFFLRNFAQALGESGQIPILLAAWSPPLAAVLLSLGLLLHLEDG